VEDGVGATIEVLSEAPREGSVRPAAPPARVPTQSRSADHAGRCNNDRTAGLNHDSSSVEIATIVRAAMRATTATFRGLGTETREAQQGGECRYRQDLSGHLPGPPWFFVMHSE
jgi:hypothetical protein